MTSLLVLAGGENTRLKPLSDTTYKAFIPIHGMSMIARHATYANHFGFSRLLVAVDTADALTKSFIRSIDTDGMTCELISISGSTAQKLVGVARAFPELDPLIVCLGDTFARVDLQLLGATPTQRGTDSAVVAARYRLPFGRFLIEGATVAKYTEKPVTEALVNTGYLALGKEALRHLSEHGDLADTLTWLTECGDLSVSEVVDEMQVVDSLADLAAAHEFFES